MVETAVVLGVFVAILLGSVDLGLVLLRRISLTAGARHVARAATVHGRSSRAEQAAWGPDRFSGTAADGTDVALSICPALMALDPRLVTIQLEWPDGDNQVGQRVRVTTEYRHESVFPFLYGAHTDLRAMCVMRISH
jgi:hypothetical protein